MNGQTIVVKKRLGAETLDVREFIRPSTYMVIQYADALWRRSRTPSDFIAKAYQYVVEDIHTPTGDLLTRDWHAMYAYHDSGSTTPLVFVQTNDFWAFPSETMNFKIGDCDDKCILLASILRRYLSDKQVWCTVGTFQGVGHMWVVVGNRVLETTAKRPFERESAPYDPMFRFNDNRVIVLRDLQDTPLM